MKHPRWFSSTFVGCMALIGTLSAPVAHAGTIEDAFRGFIARMQASGQRIQEVPGTVRGSREVTVPEGAKRVDSLPLGENEVAVFVDAGCRSCRTAVDDLRRRGYRVEVFDLTSSAVARQSFALTGAKGVPAILFGGRVMSGYSWALFERQWIQDVQDKAREAQGSGS